MPGEPLDVYSTASPMLRHHFDVGADFISHSLPPLICRSGLGFFVSTKLLNKLDSDRSTIWAYSRVQIWLASFTSFVTPMGPLLLRLREEDA